MVGYDFHRLIGQLREQQRQRRNIKRRSTANVSYLYTG
jgi:hypothetical protein